MKKLCELKDILCSGRGSIQMAIVYDTETNKDIEVDCSIDYAVLEYGNREVKRIQADNGYLVISI